MPSFEDLDLTVAALDVENLGAVARDRHVSQSTVSRAVQRVEAEVGAVFVREGRTIKTDPDARTTIAELRAIADRWRTLRSGDGARLGPRLTIFCTVTASQTIAVDLLRRFRSRHPDVALDLRTGPASDALDAAETGDVDAAIAPLPDRAPRGVAVHPLATTAFVAVASEPVDWREVTVIVPRSGLTRALVERWCRSSLRGPWNVQETNTHEEAVTLAAVGSGVAIVPGLVHEASPLRAHLHIAVAPAPLPALRIGLVAHSSMIEREPLALLWHLASYQPDPVEPETAQHHTPR
jgi:LysR family transcriptional regulator, positive regulator for ilvC